MKFFDMPFQVLFPSKAWRFSAVLLLSGIELYIRLLIPNLKWYLPGRFKFNF